MSFQHINAIIRMRWQMARNQFFKSGKANQIISAILLVIAVLTSVGSLVFAIGWGNFFLARVKPSYIIYVWDVLVAIFLFGWSITLMIEIQRTEMLSLKNLLHLPISLRGAFFLNYTSSLVNFVLMLFLPVAIGLCIASAACYGTASMVTFALLASFVLMVSAVTYQLRGWLARLMENKRTRGTVISMTVLVFVLLFQIPNIINLSSIGRRGDDTQALREVRNQLRTELSRQLKESEIDVAEYKRQSEKILSDYEQKRQMLRDAKAASFQRTVSLANACLPIGWLPYGASAAARGSILTPWMCVLGMTSIGMVSLTLAHRSTIRTYTGNDNKEHRPRTKGNSKTSNHSKMLERTLPLLSDQQSAIALATFRCTLRAPEAKMALLTPVIFAGIFGSMMLTGNMSKLPAIARPWLGIGVLGMSVFGMSQLMLNVFGLDRQGFRAYVLMPVARRDILLGKNIATLPIAATLSGLLIGFAAFMLGMNIMHVVASFIQIMIVFFLYFPISNYTSIVAPIGMGIGTMKPVSMNFRIIVTQMLAMLLSPITLLPAVIALACEQIASFLLETPWVPIYLLITLIELPVAIWFYRKMLRIQGTLLQDREQKILDVISKVCD